MITNETQNVKITNSDPSALGLFGLAMACLVSSSQKLGITEGVSFILPWAIFLGGFAQLFACINDSKRNNVFGATAFGGFAFFWMSGGLSWLIKASFWQTIFTSRETIWYIQKIVLNILICRLKYPHINRHNKRYYAYFYMDF